MEAVCSPACDMRLELASEMLNSGRTVTIRALGSSMVPAIWPGDLLTIESAAPEEIILGDIILFLQQRRLYVHRVASVQACAAARSWTTRGDALLHDDPCVQESELLGRVRAVRGLRGRVEPGRHVSQPARVLSYLIARSSRFHNVALRVRACALALRTRTFAR
jgi:signal peptidase I